MDKQNSGIFGAILSLAILVAIADWVFPEWGIPDWFVNLAWLVIAVFILLFLFMIVVAAAVALYMQKNKLP